MSLLRINPLSEIEQFQRRLLSSGTALEYQIRGCTDEELESLESKYGHLPESYRQIMLLVGRRAGKLVDRREFDFYIDQVIDLNKWWRSTENDDEEDSFELPENIFFISSRYGDHCNFVLTNQDQHDSPVYRWHEDDSVSERYPSVWNWLKDFEEEAKYWMKQGVR